jgi:hypothetical protein
MNIDGGDEDVRKLNSFLIDPFGIAHHVVLRRMTLQRSNAMITKRFVLAASMMVLVTGQAYAGTTISDKRYWPSEASSADQNAVKGSENAFDSMEMPRGIEAPGPSYHGGPKESY